MASSEPVKVSPKDLKNAQSFYHSFIQAGKWGMIVIASFLLLMALIFV